MSNFLTDEQTFFLHTGRREGHVHAMIMLDTLMRRAAGLNWAPAPQLLRNALAVALEHRWDPTQVVARRVHHIGTVGTEAGVSPAFFATEAAVTASDADGLMWPRYIGRIPADPDAT